MEEVEVLVEIRMVNVQRRKNGNYEFRKRVPKQLQGHYGKIEIILSLGTKDHEKACRAGKVLREKYDKEFNALTIGLAPIEAAKNSYHLSLQKPSPDHEGFGYGVHLRTGTGCIELQVDDLEVFDDVELGNLDLFLRTDISSMKWVIESGRFSEEAIDICFSSTWGVSLLEICNIVCDVDLADRRQRIKAIRHVINDLCRKMEAVRRTIRGIMDGEALKETSSTVSAVHSISTQDPSSNADTLFSNITRKYLDKHDLKPNSIQGLKEGVELFIEWGGDMPISQYSVDDLVGYRNNCLRKLPKNRNKRQEYKNKTLRQAVKLCVSGDERIGSRRIDSLISNVRAIFGYAVKLRLIDFNPASDLNEPKPKTSKPVDKSYSDEELKALFGVLEYDKKHPSHYWVVMLGLYNSLRIREACQLLTNDIVVEGGIFCLDINEDDSIATKKSVKNHSSARIVPIHPDIITAGFLNFVEQRRDQLKNKNGLLFSDVTFAGRGGYSEAVGKWFNRTLKPKFLSPDNTTQNGFHSFRNTFGRYAKNRAKMSPDARKVMMGHSSDKGSEVHDRYSVEEISFLYDELMKLDYGLELPPNPFVD
jgi:integrase